MHYKMITGIEGVFQEFKARFEVANSFKPAQIALNKVNKVNSPVC